MKKSIISLFNYLSGLMCNNQVMKRGKEEVVAFRGLFIWG